MHLLLLLNFNFYWSFNGNFISVIYTVLSAPEAVHDIYKITSTYLNAGINSSISSPQEGALLPADCTVTMLCLKEDKYFNLSFLEKLQYG